MTTELYQTPALEASRRPIVTVRGGDVFANSRDVAAFFAKEHRDVLRSIDTLVAQEPGLALRNFAQGSYTLPATGDQQHRCFDMNRDGFTLLAMGFTGGKALRWKLAYIEAFNAMEAELRKSPSIVLDYSDPKVLLGVLDHLQTKVSEQQAVIAEQGEKVKQLARLEGARGSMCLSDAAKTLGWKRADFIARLAAEPDDPEGWVRLVRSYSVLGDTARRDAALTQAKARYADNPQILRELAQAAEAEPMR